MTTTKYYLCLLISYYFGEYIWICKKISVSLMLACFESHLRESTNVIFTRVGVWLLAKFKAVWVTEGLKLAWCHLRIAPWQKKTVTYKNITRNLVVFQEQHYLSSLQNRIANLQPVLPAINPWSLLSPRYFICHLFYCNLMTTLSTSAKVVKEWVFPVPTLIQDVGLWRHFVCSFKID